MNLLSLLSVWSSSLHKSKSNVDCVKLYWPVCSIILTISCSLWGSCNEFRCLWSRFKAAVSHVLGDDFLDWPDLVDFDTGADGGWSSLSLSLLVSDPLESPPFFTFFIFNGFLCERSPSSNGRLTFCEDGGMELFPGPPPVMTPPALRSLLLNSSLGFWKVRHSLRIWLMGGSLRFGKRRSYSKRTFFGSSLLRK